MDQAKIGRFIAELRKERKMTQSQLGEKLGVSYKAVSKWETGRNLPDPSPLQTSLRYAGHHIDRAFQRRADRGKRDGTEGGPGHQ